MSRTITPKEIVAEKGTVTILDVRRKGDFDSDTVRIAGATWKDPEKVAEWGKALSKDEDVVIYCVRGGSVSNSVVDHLQGQGVKARFVEGGIEAWKQAGGATEPK